MKDWERIYSDLLGKVQEICEENGIDIFLMDFAALGAVRNGRLTDNDVGLCAPAEDAVRLERLLRDQADESFGVESPLTNSRYRGAELRVYDPRTIDCDTEDFFRYENNCMHVTVHFIKPDRGSGSAAGRFIGRLQRKLSGSLPGGRSGAADEFRKLADTTSKGSGTVSAGRYKFSGVIFETKKAVSLYDREYYIPADADAYLVSQFGYGWEYYEAEPFEPGDRRFRYTDRSWADWRAKIRDEDVTEYEKLRAEYRAGSAEYRKAHREVVRVYGIIDRNYDRIQFYKKLVPREAELEGLAAEGRYEELEEAVLPYLKALKKYYDKGQDLYIDGRIADITDGLLRHKGHTAFADALVRTYAAPGSGRGREIKLRDYRGELIDINQTGGIIPGAPSYDHESELSETQQTLLLMMKRIDAFLREKGIRYYLFGGSLLGAIRHNGFIPWDDDIDILMDRDDYYRLVELADELPWDDIRLDCWENGHKFQRPFGIFTYLRDTRFVKSRVFMGGEGLGTGIDVFLMDNVPREHLDEYLRNSLLYQNIMTDALLTNTRILEHRDEYFACKEREKHDGKVAEVLRLRDELEKYGPPQPDDLKIVRLWARKPRIYEAGMMDDPVYHKFEDAEFPVPARAEECLLMQYGETWNVVPPDGERREHAFKIDYELGAANYYDAISEETDWEQVSRALDVRKRCEMRLLDKKLKLDEIRNRIHLRD